jgi:hypothetical protein
LWLFLHPLFFCAMVIGVDIIVEMFHYFRFFCNMCHLKIIIIIIILCCF